MFAKICLVHEPNRFLRFNAGLFNFKGMCCISRSHMLRIEPNGDVRGLVCSQAKPFANIFDPHFDPASMQPEIIICAKDNCGCDANDCVPKFRDTREAEAFVSNFNNGLLHGNPNYSADGYSKPVGIHEESVRDIAELVMSLRPDVRAANMADGEPDYFRILLWAWQNGRVEVPILARAEKVLTAALARMHKTPALDAQVSGYSTLLASLVASRPDLQELANSGQEHIVAWFAASGIREYGLEDILSVEENES